MCGIAGLINISGRLSPETMHTLAQRMANAMAYRGPDDSGVWVDPTGTCALSQRRLSIIDLSAGGHQPMIAPDSGDALTFNGELYNYLELRPLLQAKGYSFQSSSDTEVLLKGLMAEGTAFLDRIDGMFAFAYFNAKDRSVTLARDIFGEKPLYYAQTEDWFAFSSELHALTLLPGFDPAIDRHRIATYLALQYLPAPMTIYKTAQKLPHGCSMTIQPDGSSKITKYFQFSASPAQTSGLNLDTLADELEEILIDSVRTRVFASDVPVGAFLSSGVDSSTMVALAMKQMSSPIKTFSIGFLEGTDSEHVEAEAMARHLGSEHTTEILPIDFFKTREHLATIMDEPNGDSSCLPTWAVSRTARRHATVALSGDGGDELFGGYNRYPVTLQDEARMKGSPDWNLGKTYFFYRMMIFVDPTLEKVMGSLPEETVELIASIRGALNSGTKPALQLMRECDVEYYMPGDILAKVDRMSMQHSLEVRSPLLGRKVANFAMRMAADDLGTATTGKEVLKRVAQRYIPREWLDRKKKGFGIPLVEEWGGVSLAKELEGMLCGSDSKLAAWIPPDRLRRFVNFHLATPNNSHMWVVYILEQWLRTHPCRAV